MILSSDIILYHSLWERADKELVDDFGVFSRLIDIYILACSIGIKEDKIVVAVKDPAIEEKNIGRNTYMSLQNTDLHDALDFMLQNALINSKTLELDSDERLKLAFDPDYTVNKLSAASILTGFANYGIEQIYKKIDSSSPLVVIDELYKYFNELVESRYDDIMKAITLEDN